MQAIRVHQLGEPDVLTYETVDTPQPTGTQVRVKIEAVGINYVDLYQRSGLYQMETPYIPGLEAAGVVDAIGEEVTRFEIGDRVAYAQQAGAYAEFAVVPQAKLVKLPDEIETRTGAALMLQGLTAHYLAYSTFPLHPGHTALVHAAAGGVGLLLVQIAKQRGAFVIGTVSTEEKAELAREAGADEVILYTQADFEAETLRITEQQGVDVAYDSVGLTTFDKSLNCLKPRGYLVLYGQASGRVPAFD